MLTKQHLNWHVASYVQKWDDADFLDEHGLVGLSADELESEGVNPTWEGLWYRGNLLCNNGINRLCNLVIGTGSIVAYTNAVARLAVGNGTTAVTAADTDLSAASTTANRWFKSMDSTYPSVATQVMTFKSTYATGDANFAWNEWGIDGGVTNDASTVGINDATHAALLNRVKPGSSLGTKASGSSWALTVTVTMS